MDTYLCPSVCVYNVDLYVACFVASPAGHQAQANGPVRPRKERGPTPDWTMDVGEPLQW